MEADVVKIAQSECATPVVLFPKKDEYFDFFVDYWCLNTATLPDIFLMPHMDDYIDSLRDAQVFTTLDALWECWQVTVKYEGKDKTKFKSHFGT